jgi:hypothetical protein
MGKRGTTGKARSKQAGLAKLGVLLGLQQPGSGMLDEFALIYSLKHKFPLHYIAFRQCASHISHEADVESLFFLSKGLTNWNMRPGFLRVLTLLKSTSHEPTINQIWGAYKKKYGIHECVDLTTDKNDSESDFEEQL